MVLPKGVSTRLEAQQLDSEFPKNDNMLEKLQNPIKPFVHTQNLHSYMEGGTPGVNSVNPKG